MLDGNFGGSIFQRLFQHALEDEVGIASGEWRQRGAGILGVAKLVEDLVRELVAVEMHHAVCVQVAAVNVKIWFKSGKVWMVG